MILKCPFCFKKLKPSLVGAYFECKGTHGGFYTHYQSYTNDDNKLSIKLPNSKILEFVYSKNGIRTNEGIIYNIIHKKTHLNGPIEFQFCSKEKQSLTEFLGSNLIDEIVNRFEKLMILD